LEIKHSIDEGNNSSNIISEYVANVSMMNKLTANEYHARLDIFKRFVNEKYSTDIDDIISKIKKNGDPYSLLIEYARYLQNRNISTSTLKQRIVTVKNFFEYHDIDISPRRFKLKVKLPKIIRKNKEALSKEDIVEILNTYLTFLNVHQLERQGADIQTKVEELEELNQSLRQRDKVKDDAIAQLSDQLLSLSARLQEIEKTTTGLKEKL
jgi:integrase